MKLKYISIIFLLLISRNIIPSQRPFSPSSYSYLTNDDIKSGYKTSELGEHLIVTKSLLLKGSANFNSHTNIDGSAQSNILISITKPNVTLDLNYQSIKTNKSGYIAIAIADGVSGVTIQNGTIASGTKNFNNAILIGKNCSNITFKNITIEESSNSNFGTLDFKGSSSQPAHNITLENISIYNSSTTGIRCTNINNLSIKNIICSSINSSKKLSAIFFNNCNYIQCKNIQTTLNQGTGETIGIKIANCKDAHFSNILSSSNQDKIVGAYTKNILVLGSYNVEFENIESTNTGNAHCGFGLLNSKNITISKLLICNSASGSNSTFTGLYLANSHSINIDNCSITNCTGQTNFNGILCDTTKSTDIKLHNVDIAQNIAISGNLTGINLKKNEFVELSNITVSQNESNSSTWGLKATNEVKNLFCNKCSFIYNKSTTNQSDTQVAGLLVTGANGVRINECLANYNNGGAQAVGFFLHSTEACEIKNSKAHMNYSSSNSAQAKISAGFYLYNSSHCVLFQCDALHNKGGSYAAGAGGTSTINSVTCCGGFGLANIGADTNNVNIGNQFIECNFDGNGTQHINSNPGNQHQRYQGQNYRYWESQALAGGALEYNSQQSMYQRCTFNNNGISHYVYGGGLIVASGSKNIFVNQCMANNNTYYGYVDLNPECETFFVGSFCLGNGSYNSIASQVTSTQKKRNVLVPYGAKDPFYEVKMDDYATINNRNSPMHNYNIIQRS